MAQKKTLAMKLLEGKKVPYEALDYSPALRDAVEVAGAIDMPPAQVFKTLVVVRAQPGKPLLAMVPANQQLDLKKLAKASGEKKLKMASHDEAERLTGLQVGGISALALVNRGFDVYLDLSAEAYDEIVVSGGERGQQIKLGVKSLTGVTGARTADFASER
ncbi:MAG: aminoacyl-tRNA deacylase [Candidatus Promineifilaceae bacterium]